MDDRVGASHLQLRGVSKFYGPARALDAVDLDVRPGELMSILGPSGSGKSTLLRAVAGLETAQGEVLIGGRQVEALSPKERGVAFVFQSYALYPHMSVAENIAAPLVMKDLHATDRIPILGAFMPGAKARRIEIAKAVKRTAELLQIEPFLDRRPAQLSGGQRQRVALARALIREPSLFLLDEPLANLDASLRVRTRSELRSLQRQLGTTTLFVTHDQAEAMAISDRIAVMFDGRIRQVGSPDELYRHPVDLDVARFLSQPVLNTLPARRTGPRTVEAAGASFAVDGQANGPGVLAFRPEDASLSSGELQTGDIASTVDFAEHAGADAHIHLMVGDRGTPCVIRVRSTELERWAPGTKANLHIDAQAAWFFAGAEDGVAANSDRASLRAVA